MHKVSIHLASLETFIQQFGDVMTSYEALERMQSKFAVNQ